MSTATVSAVRIPLVSPCGLECFESRLGQPLYEQMSNGYELCSVLPVPESVEEWRESHRTARKRANRAANLGYRFSEIARERHDEDIYAINTSKNSRQGRPMSAGYRDHVHFLPLEEYPCPRHAIRTYGVLDTQDTLVAYLWLYRAGELALVSSILGHGEHLDNDVMFLLFQGAVERQAGLGGYFVYNRADSGTSGLRYFKEKLGFEPMEVEWVL